MNPLTYRQMVEDIQTWFSAHPLYDAKGEEGLARLSTAEYYYALGGLNEARGFAMRARDLLDKDSVGWRRATDIVLTANPSREAWLVGGGDNAALVYAQPR